MRARNWRGRSNCERTIRRKLFFVMRSIFSIDRSCRETRFPARDAAIPSVSLLGSVGVPFSAGEVDGL